MIKNILWDFDGVFVDSVPLKGKGFYEVYMKFGEKTAVQVEKDHYSMGGVSRYEKFKKWHKEYLNKEINEIQIEKLAHEYSSFVKEKVIAGSLTKGLEDFLKSHSNTYKNWVISGTPHNEMNDIIERKDLTQYFDSVYGSPRSKIQWVEEILLDHTLNPSETVFIGDANSDYKAAKKFNFHFIVVNHDYNENDFGDAVMRIDDFTNFQQKLSQL